MEKVGLGEESISVEVHACGLDAIVYIHLWLCDVYSI